MRLFNRKIKKYIRRDDMFSAIRAEILAKGVLEIFFFAKFEKGGSTYSIIKSTRYEFNDANYKLLNEFQNVPLIDRRVQNYAA